MQYDLELAAGTDDLEEVDWLSLAGKRFEQGMASEGEKEAKEEAKTEWSWPSSLCSP